MSWEEGFKSAVRQGRRGWNVANNNGRMQLKLRGKFLPIAPQTANLPFPWHPNKQADALLLINRVYGPVMDRKQSLKQAIIDVLGQSDQKAHLVLKGWPQIAESLRVLRMEGVNQILPTTWRDNWEPYINHALEVLATRNQPSDGHELLQKCLMNWQGRPSSRAACCLALKNFTEHAVVRHNMPSSWLITQTSIKELRGRKPEKRIKATLTDSECLALIEGINNRNPAWANVLRLMVQFGLRPIELQYLTLREDHNGESRLWCSYRKVSGPNKCEPRFLMSSPLLDSEGVKVEWNLISSYPLLELPLAKDGNRRKLNGHYVEVFLKTQPEWIKLKKEYEQRGEWLRPYTFRDTYSVRCHRLRFETAQICRAMGHGLAAHSRAYRSATDQTMFEAFDQLSA